MKSHIHIQSHTPHVLSGKMMMKNHFINVLVAVDIANVVTSRTMMPKKMETKQTKRWVFLMGRTMTSDEHKRIIILLV